MKLYSVVNSDNTINKVKNLVADMPITLLGEINLLNPTILIDNNIGNQIYDANYCFIKDLKRYYFIRTIELEGDFFNLKLECDVLETFKDDILKCYCEYNSPIKPDDYGVIIGNVDLDSEYSKVNSDVTIDRTNTLVLSTIGEV